MKCGTSRINVKEAMDEMGLEVLRSYRWPSILRSKLDIQFRTAMGLKKQYTIR